MNKLTKLMANSTVAVMMIVLSVVAIVIGFYWQNESITTQQATAEQRQQKQFAEVIHSSISTKVNDYQRIIAAIAQSSDITAVLNDPVLFAQKQSQLKQQLPGLQKLCFLPMSIDSVDNNACIPVTFAALENIRTAKSAGNAPMAMMKAADNTDYLLMTHRIQSGQAVLGVLAVAFSADVVQKLLLPSFGQAAYIEIQQGQQALALTGDKQYRQSQALFQKAIANSHWQLAYWPKTTPASFQYAIVASIVLVIVLLMWLLRERTQRMVVLNDIDVLKTQLNDLNNSELKAKYPTIIPEMDGVVDEIKRLGHILPVNVQAKTNKPAAAATIEVSEVDDVARDEPDPVNTPEASGNSAELEFTLEPEPAPEVTKIAELTPAIFKAYDIRGIVGQTLHAENVIVIGQAIGSTAIEKGLNRIVVGRDGRLSSEQLSQALITGLMASGCEVIDIGLVPTPLVSFACEHLATQAGVMVTASHNPPDYNGLKITLGGQPLFGSALQQLYQRILQGNLLSGDGQVQQLDIIDDYIARISNDIHLIRPLKVIIDCGNGVAGLVIPKLLTALGCEVSELYCEVDGTFPNHQPNPSEPANLQDLIVTVKQNGADLGLAFDGDGDRIGTVDIEGNIIWPDRLMMLFAQDVLSRQPGALVGYDVKSTNLLEQVILNAGGEAQMWQSGYARLRHKMLETGAILAGEMSGHIFFKDRWYGFDDALYTACRLVELLARDPLERSPQQLFAELPNRENTPEIVVEMEELACQKFLQQFIAGATFTDAKMTKVDGLRADFVNGWGLVRSSNTLPGLTLRFEADSQPALLEIQQKFKQQMLQIEPTITLPF